MKRRGGCVVAGGALVGIENTDYRDQVGVAEVGHDWQAPTRCCGSQLRCCRAGVQRDRPLEIEIRNDAVGDIAVIEISVRRKSRLEKLFLAAPRVASNVKECSAS